MIDFNKQIREYLDTVKIDIVSEMRNQRLVASGQAISSLRVVANQFLIGELRGEAYINTLMKGYNQRPKHVGRRFLDRIINWMRIKGIQPMNDGQVSPNTEGYIKRSAYGIAQSIVDNGTRINKGEAGVDLVKILDENLPDYLEGVAGELLVSFSDNLNKK